MVEDGRMANGWIWILSDSQDKKVLLTQRENIGGLKLKGRTPTKNEKQWMGDICELGCIVCWIHDGIFTPQCSPHHIDGKTKEGAHFKTIPLCSAHHQIADTHKPKRWISRHGDGKAAFEREYGAEEFLLEQCKEYLEGEGCIYQRI